jgi:hypothetical protein
MFSSRLLFYFRIAAAVITRLHANKLCRGKLSCAGFTGEMEHEHEKTTGCIGWLFCPLDVLLKFILRSLCRVVFISYWRCSLHGAVDEV